MSSNRTVSDLGEHVLIERITARLAMPSWVVVGPGDDAAVVEPERGALEVFTTDVQVEGVHFDRRFVPSDAVGHRALAVNLSDLAAMGATPRLALLSLVLPDLLDVRVVDEIVDGLLRAAATHRVTLVGGNISRSPGPLMIDVTAVGTVRRRRALTRAGARPGDDLYVTGTIGDALVGLRSLEDALTATPSRSDAAVGPQAGAWRRCEERYLRPEPRVRVGMLIGRNRAASACIDLSDGLADGVRRIVAASRVGITLDAGALPICADVQQWHAQRGHDVLAAVLSGGDDYELLFTVRPAHRGRLRAVRRAVGDVAITKIGRVTKDRRVSIATPQGERELPAGFQHFQ